MAKENKQKIGEMRIPTEELEKEYQESLEITEAEIQSRAETETAAENINEVSELEEEFVQELTETQATEGEIQEMQSMRYVEDSPQITGFQSSQEQFNQYEIITNIIGLNTSVLDFGCGRGDYFGWHASRYGQGKLNYIGIDANKVLIEAGKKLYDTIVLLNKDWTQLEDNIQNDWSININSNNLRYDLTSKSDSDYLFETIEAMYKHARVGILLSLSSSMNKNENGFIKHNPGDILNWAQEKYGSVAIDHSSSNEQFYLIFYKNEN